MNIFRILAIACNKFIDFIAPFGYAVILFTVGAFLFDAFGVKEFSSRSIFTMIYVNFAFIILFIINRILKKYID